LRQVNGGTLLSTPSQVQDSHLNIASGKWGNTPLNPFTRTGLSSQYCVRYLPFYL